METYEKWDIQETPLSAPFFRDRVRRFLEANGLRMEELDAYYSVPDAEGEILAGAGIAGSVIKCVAVSEAARSEGLLVPLISHIISLHPGVSLRVFTKPEYEAVFVSLGFRLLARAPKALLLENGRGAERYAAYLAGFRSAVPASRSGVIVMNANPFTLGHQYLLHQAAAQCDRLFVIPVAEDVSAFPYEERLEMIRSFCHSDASACPTAADSLAHADTTKVVVLEGSDYQISALTFPTYFLKDLSEASETQMQLDLDLFGRFIAPALGVTVRFVGSEPTDALTARYNELMREILPQYGVTVVEVPRLTVPASGVGTVSASTDPQPVSASAVRAYLSAGRFATAAALVPDFVRPYLLTHLACRALQMELDTPLKPGLVCPESNGAHQDMDYALMQKGIAAIRPYFVRMARAASAQELRQLGIDAESAMLRATGGVNTHRGAIFALGLVLHVAAQAGRQLTDNQSLLQTGVHLEVHRLYGKSLIQSDLCANASGVTNVKGALAMAEGGYRELFEDWLPYYRHLKGEVPLSGAFARTGSQSDAEERGTSPLQQMLLLRIMSTLDDTCVIKRVGHERAQEVKQEAKALLEEMADQVGHDEGTAGHDEGTAGHDGTDTERNRPGWAGRLEERCRRYAAEGISPGGAADMLALTIFIDSIIV